MARLFTLQNTGVLLSDGMGLCVGSGIGKIAPAVLGHAIDADKRLVYRWRSGEATPATHYFLSLIETLPEPFAQHMLLPTGYRVERIREPGA